MNNLYTCQVCRKVPRCNCSPPATASPELANCLLLIANCFLNRYSCSGSSIHKNENCTGGTMRSGLLRRSLSVVRFCCVFAVLLAISSVLGVAQDLPPATADDAMGQQAFQSYHGGDIDSVGLGNGTLSLHFPFLSYSQRGKLSLSFNLFYNNQPQHFALTCIPDPPNGQKCFDLWGYSPSSGPLPLERGDVFVGWAQQVAITGTPTTVVLNSGLTDQITKHYESWSVQTADGAKHPLGNLGTQTMTEGPAGSPSDQYTSATGPFIALDATGWRANGSLTAPGGGVNSNTIVGPDGIIGGTQDPNGNIITQTTNSNGAPNGFFDTLGRQIPLPPPNSPTPVTADPSNCPKPPQVPLTADSAFLWSVPAPNGVNAPYTFCYASVTINMPPAGANSPYQNISTQHKLQTIILPDGHTWNFEYNDPGDGTVYNSAPVNYGTLTKITLPTGGTITYSYSTTGPNTSTCQMAGRWVATRVVNANDGTGDQKWQYSYSYTFASGKPVSLATQVIDPLNNYVVHTFNGLNSNDNCPAYEATTQSYQSDGTLLKTVSTQYKSIPGNNSKLPLNVVPQQITTTWPNGKTATVNRGYDLGYTYTDYEAGTSQGIYGKMLSESVSDFAATTVSTTSFNYEALSSDSHAGDYLAANMLDLVKTKTVADGSGCTQAQTDYSYDDPGYLNSFPDFLPSGTHGAPPNSVRGNLTTVTQELFPANSCPSTQQPGPISHTTWYDTGEIQVSSDPLGHTTTHKYNYNTSSGGNSPSQTCNALTQCVNGLYDFNTGLLTQYTDANQQMTKLEYNDPLRRITKITQPADSAGNLPVMTFDYPDANTVHRTKTITASLIDDLTTSFDGVGRRDQTAHRTPAGTATVVTAYDGNGRVSSVTNPYFTTADPTYGSTATLYDVLGRVTQITKQDGGILKPQYNQAASISTNSDCTLTQDEIQNPRRTCVDALGRLVEVDEPGSAFAGSASSGSVTISGTLQSVTVPDPNSPGSSGQGSFTISSVGTGTNGDRFVNVTTCQRIGNNNVCTTTPNYDTGTITITVNGFTTQAVTYNGGTSTVQLATAIVGKLNVSGSPVTASNSGGTSSTVTMVANATGSASNYPWSSSSATNNSKFQAGTTSFPLSPSSGALSGGQSQGTMTITDSGTVTLTIPPYTAKATYGATPNDKNALAIWNDLSNQLAAQGAPISAFVVLPPPPATSPINVSLGWNTNTSAGNVPLGITSVTSQPTYFSGTSFPSSGSGMSGGSDPYPSSLAHPYVTQYQYDALGNLVCAVQRGNDTSIAFSGCAGAPASWRPRSFKYDSLSRLVTATNPESGAISYSYDADGNLLQKTSPAPNAPQGSTATQTVSYCYDPLHRMTGKAYSAQSCPLASPAVTFSYDAGSMGIGHLTGLTDQAGTGNYVYDALGRITSETRVIAGVSKSMGYGYNLDGSIAKLTYPSNATITYTPWNNGAIAVSSPQDAKDSGSGINYATAGSYQADGQITTFVSGSSVTFNGITNTFDYNKRLQPRTMDAALPSAAKVFSITYDFHVGTGDNGNVWAITNNRDTTRSQSFTYDTLNRLTSAQNNPNNPTVCGSTTLNGKTLYWGNSYGYDPWGNLISKTITKCNAENFGVSALNNNQLTGYSYDAAGNMMGDPTDNISPVYDEENRIKGAGGYTYTYDADGARVEKSNGSIGTLYWDMAPGIVAESDLSGNLTAEYVFFNGTRIARKDLPTNAVSYYFSDHLRTASVITDSGGNIKSESDFYPWGGELQLSNNDTNRYKFTGKERDGESGLDYFGARYYSNGLSRFLTPDWAAKAAAIPYADLKDPQSLNLYSYVRNRPTVLVDLDGHEDSTSPPPVLDGQIHTTTNQDGSKTAYQGTTSTVITYNPDGTKQSETVTTSVTTVQLNAHGDVTSSVTDTKVTQQNFDHGAAQGGPQTLSSTHTVIAADNPQVKTIATAARSWGQQPAGALAKTHFTIAGAIAGLLKGPAGAIGGAVLGNIGGNLIAPEMDRQGLTNTDYILMMTTGGGGPIP